MFSMMTLLNSLPQSGSYLISGKTSRSSPDPILYERVRELLANLKLVGVQAVKLTLIGTVQVAAVPILNERYASSEKAASVVSVACKKTLCVSLFRLRNFCDVTSSTVGMPPLQVINSLPVRSRVSYATISLTIGE